MPTASSPSKLNSWSESTVMGKQLMLKFIGMARREAVRAHNIKAGWRASGWKPVSMAKPLVSRLVMENSNYYAGLKKITTSPADPSIWVTCLFSRGS